MEKLVEHLVILSGDLEKVEALKERPFSFSELLPHPLGLDDINELDLLAFHIVFGDLNEGWEIAQELNMDWPFSEKSPSSEEVRTFLAQRPDLRKSAHKAGKALSMFGHPSSYSWKKEHWGAASDISAEYADDFFPGTAVVRFFDKVQRLTPLVDIALKYPEFDVEVIVVDSKAKTQAWFSTIDSALKGERVILTEVSFEDELALIENSWLIKPPDGFQSL